jgi:hypothetical protein
LRKEEYSEEGLKELSELCVKIGTSLDCIGAATYCDQRRIILAKIYAVCELYKKEGTGAEFRMRQIIKVMKEWEETKSGMAPIAEEVMSLADSTERKLASHSKSS